MKVGIALGSNLGESKKILTQAIEELKKIHTGAPSSLDFFRNSTDAANCSVAPVLGASSSFCTLNSCAPSTPCTSSASASLERSLFLTSSFHETDPVDCPPHSPRFLNAVIQLETELSPNALIKILQKMELDSGRPSLHSLNAPRTLDLDLLYCDKIILSTPHLTLPHPRMFERLFVLAPLAEIAPELILPGEDKTIAELKRNQENIHREKIN